MIFWPNGAFRSGDSAAACRRMSWTQVLGPLAPNPGRSTTTISRSFGRDDRNSAQYSDHDGDPAMTTNLYGAGFLRGVSTAVSFQPRLKPASKVARRTWSSG